MVNFCPNTTLQVVYVGRSLVELARDQIVGEYSVSPANGCVVLRGVGSGRLCLVLLQTTGYFPEEPVFNKSYFNDVLTFFYKDEYSLVQFMILLHI